MVWNCSRNGQAAAAWVGGVPQRLPRCSSVGCCVSLPPVPFSAGVSCLPHPTLSCPPPPLPCLQCIKDSDLIFAASGSEEILVHPEDVADMPAASQAVSAFIQWF